MKASTMEASFAFTLLFAKDIFIVQTRENKILL